MFIVGHVNKDGAIAGPKVMEHIVDTVLYFEGDKMLPYRILRAAKNRYGSTNELGMFDMTGQGLAEIENPSQMLLEGRPLGVSGNCVACTMEGSRPILSEIQALATKTNFPAPRRACSGYDYNRMNLLIAVLEKRAGYFFGNLDVYINIVGGIALRDTACDLSVCLSMVSSLLDRPVSDKLIAIGEVGLGGEVRSVPNMEQRLHPCMPRPWRASSFAISCTVSWMASRFRAFAFLASSILPAQAPDSASTRICRFFLVLSVRTSPSSSANLEACSASSKA